MIYFWARKPSIATGYAADLCPICRGARPFQIFAVKHVAHFNFIPLGTGKTVAHIAKCMDCGIRLGVELEEYANLQKTKPHDIGSLIANTRPYLVQDYQDRLEIERLIKNRKLSEIDAETRSQLLWEPFQLIEPWFLNRYEETKIDKPTGIGCLGTLALTCFFLFILDIKPGSLSAKIAVGLVCTGFLYTIISGITANGRHIKTWIYPTLARSLRPLLPTILELQRILDKLSRDVSRHFRKIKADKIMEHIHAPTQRTETLDARLTKDVNQLH